MYVHTYAYVLTFADSSNDTALEVASKLSIVLAVLYGNQTTSNMCVYIYIYIYILYNCKTTCLRTYIHSIVTCVT